MKKNMFRFSLLGSALLLAGCINLAPDYERPASSVAAQWPQGPAYKPADTATIQDAVADIGWREFFADTRLHELIALALDNNRDLRVSALNIQKAQAMYQIRRADQFPTIGVSAGESAQRVPASLSMTGSEMISRSYSVGLGISNYELDFFGRLQNLKESALEQYLSTEEAWRSMQISLVAQVAYGYLNLVADRQRLSVAKETLTSQQDSYKLVVTRFDAGIASQLDVRQAQTSVESASVDVATYTAAVAQDINALTLLVGAEITPQMVTADKMTEVSQVASLSAGSIPSDVLLRRPDVLQAEHVLKSANAEIGSARAAYFPSITLTTSVGTASASLSGLFKAGSGAWTFMPNIDLPIFDMGRRSANLDIANVQRDIAVAQYEQAIQSAFRDVADALAQRGTVDDQLAAQQRLLEATTESYKLAMARYEKGVDNYLNVLDAQRQMYGASQGLVTIQLGKQASQVSLYKALGGGWTEYRPQAQEDSSPSKKGNS